MACTRCEYLRAQGALLIEKGLMVKARFAAIRAGTLKEFERKALPDHERRVKEAGERVENARLAMRAKETPNAEAAIKTPDAAIESTSAAKPAGKPPRTKQAGNPSAAHGKRGVAKAARGRARS